jgi:hypothetical protein
MGLKVPGDTMVFWWPACLVKNPIPDDIDEPEHDLQSGCHHLSVRVRSLPLIG